MKRLMNWLVAGLLLVSFLAWSSPVPAAVQEWEMVNPEGVVAAVKSLKVAPRLDTLEGKTVGLRANGKHNSDLFLNRVAELLKEQVKDVKIIKFYEVVPSSFSYPLKPEEIQKLADLKPDIVIGSHAD